MTGRFRCVIISILRTIGMIGEIRNRSSNGEFRRFSKNGRERHDDCLNPDPVIFGGKENESDPL